MTADDKLFQLFNEIGIIAQLSGTLFERVMPDGMTLAQFTVLNHFVRLGGERSPAQLAAAFQVTRGTMTSTLQKLEAKNLVDIAPDKADARAKIVRITETGRRMRERCISALGPKLADLSQKLEGLDMDSTIEPLQRLRRELDRARDD